MNRVHKLPSPSNGADQYIVEINGVMYNSVKLAREMGVARNTGWKWLKDAYDGKRSVESLLYREPTETKAMRLRDVWADLGADEREAAIQAFCRPWGAA